MKHCSKTVAFAILATGVAFAAILKFDSLKMIEHLQSDVQDVMNLVMKPRTLSRYIPSEVYEKMGLDPSTRLMSYRWNNCGDTTEENLIIHDIQIKPDPIVFPGSCSVSFDLDIKVTLFELKVVVKMSKKIASSWIQLPCNGMIGSCTYSDVCTFLVRINKCPPDFQKANIPCRCPFKNGTYILPTASFKVDVGFLRAGDYHIRANLTDESVNFGCYDIYASLG